MNRKDLSFLGNMFHEIELNHINAVVINQITTIDMPRNLLTPHPGIRVFSVNEQGLAKSRNMALQYSKGDILVLADDDLVYEKKALETIRRYHAALPQTEILTFQITGAAKTYSTRQRAHNLRSILRVSSVEITLKRSFLAKKILFDERFGLGAHYPMGEENIWLLDALRAGTKTRFVPQSIVSHTGVSTGKRYDVVDEKARGAVFARMYGLLAMPLYGWFSIKKYRSFRKKHSLLTEIYYLLVGGWHFIFSSPIKR